MTVRRGTSKREPRASLSGRISQIRLKPQPLDFNRLRFRADSFWYTKSNAFTLLLTLCEFSDRLEALDYAALKRGLASISDNPPEDYALAAKEGVNNKKERTLRAGYVRGIANSAGGNAKRRTRNISRLLRFGEERTFPWPAVNGLAKN